MSEGLLAACYTLAQNNNSRVLRRIRESILVWALLFFLNPLDILCCEAKDVYWPTNVYSLSQLDVHEYLDELDTINFLNLCASRLLKYLLILSQENHLDGIDFGIFRNNRSAVFDICNSEKALNWTVVFGDYESNIRIEAKECDLEFYLVWRNSGRHTSKHFQERFSDSSFKLLNFVEDGAISFASLDSNIDNTKFSVFIFEDPSRSKPKMANSSNFAKCSRLGVLILYLAVSSDNDRIGRPNNYDSCAVRNGLSIDRYFGKKYENEEYRAKNYRFRLNNAGIGTRSGAPRFGWISDCRGLDIDVTHDGQDWYYLLGSEF